MSVMQLEPASEQIPEVGDGVGAFVLTSFFVGENDGSTLIVGNSVGCIVVGDSVGIKVG